MKKKRVVVFDASTRLGHAVVDAFGAASHVWDVIALVSENAPGTEEEVCDGWRKPKKWPEDTQVFQVTWDRESIAPHMKGGVDLFFCHTRRSDYSDTDAKREKELGKLLSQLASEAQVGLAIVTTLPEAPVDMLTLLKDSAVKRETEEHFRKALPQRCISVIPGIFDEHWIHFWPLTRDFTPQKNLSWWSLPTNLNQRFPLMSCQPDWGNLIKAIAEDEQYAGLLNRSDPLYASFEILSAEEIVNQLTDILHEHVAFRPMSSELLDCVPMDTRTKALLLYFGVRDLGLSMYANDMDLCRRLVPSYLTFADWVRQHRVEVGTGSMEHALALRSALFRMRVKRSSNWFGVAALGLCGLYIYYLLRSTNEIASE